MADIVTSAWGHVGMGSYVIGPDGDVWKVLDCAEDGSQRMLLINRAGDRQTIVRPADDTPVQFYVHKYVHNPAAFEEFKAILGAKEVTDV